MAQAGRSGSVGLRGIKALTFISLLPPLVALVAVFGTRFGLWSFEHGREFMGLTVVPVLAWTALAAAVGVVLLALRYRKGAWPYVLTAGVSALASLGVSQWQMARLDGPPVNDVTTNAAEAPPFSRAVMADRRGVDLSAVACEGLEPVMRQVAPETAAYALERAGFHVRGTAPFRADGLRAGFWFGQIHDAAIRIRPGRTDVRVAARFDVRSGDEACRLARAITAELQPAES